MSPTAMNDSDSAKEQARVGCCPTSQALNIDYGNENRSSNATSLTQPYEVTVLFGVLETLIALGAVVGNILVIGSVYTNRKLRTITNLFVVSLAFSDLMVGLLVLPFAIKVQVTNAWGLGGVICDIFVTLDVLLCTASILNLCCISIDRYFAITHPLACATKRSKRLALLMIAAVWVLSIIITIPPLLGWKEPNRPNDGRGDTLCELIQENNYVIYSALGSFYIPLAIMLFVYANIFVVARNAQRRWRNHSSKGSSVRSSKPGSTSPSPVAARSPNFPGDDEERGSLGAGIRPRATRVISAASDTVCCGCFGRGQWTGTYSLTVADDWSMSPGVFTESYNRQRTPGCDATRRSILIYDTRPRSVGHDPRSCSLEHDRGRCSMEHCSGLCPTRPYSQLSDLGSNGKIATGPETRKSSSESEVRLSGVGTEARLSVVGLEARLSVVGPDARLSRVGPEARLSDDRTVPCVVETTDLPECTRSDTPSELPTKQCSDAQDRKGTPPKKQKSPSTLFSWQRRHSSLDCLYYTATRQTIAESIAHAKTHSGEYQGHVICNRNLVIRHSDSLPTHLIRNRTVSITTTSTTPSTGSRSSTSSGDSGASAEGNCVPQEAKNPAEMNSANIDRPLNPRRSALRFDKRAIPHSDRVSCKTTLEPTSAALTENSEPNQNCSDARRGPDSCLFESPRRRVATGEFNASFRSILRAPRSQNQAADDSRSYGSFADVTMTPTMARQMSRLSQKTRSRRENSAIFRETKTVKTVSIVIGCFVLCWLPFFVVYISEPFLPYQLKVHPYLWQFVTWLGYFNSVINPFIYAFYNYEFRSTFWLLTIGRFWKRGRRLPRGIAPSSPLNNVLRYQPSVRNSSVIVLNRLSANR